MKKKKVMLLCAMALVLAAGTGLTSCQSAKQEDSGTEQDAETESGESAKTEKKASDEDAGDANTKEEIKVIYDTESQAQIAAALAQEKAADSYTEDHMLVKQNPFGTNTQSLYVYFQTPDAVKVTYTVHVEDASINDFTETAWQAEEYQTDHEIQVIGLIPDTENTVTFTLKGKDGAERTQTISYDMGSILGDEATVLEGKIKKADQLENGLYVILGNDSESTDFMYYYDNQGVLRGEVPIWGYRSHRLLFSGDSMYYSISTTEIAQVNRLGQVLNVYNLGQYKLHHDYVFDDEGNILILASDTTQKRVEDVVIRLNKTTGAVEEVVDMGDLFPDYLKEREEEYEKDDGELDWMHINSIQWMGNDSIILSSRETSSIIKLKNISTDPQVEYMLGEKAFWKGTGYEDLVYEKDGDFIIQGGQHSVTYEPDASLPEGSYYIYMFNNNIGISTSRADFDWDKLGLIEDTGKDGDASYYYKYLVNEQKGTFELVDSFELPYSGYVSSVQDLGTHTVVDSGIPGTFGEYDENHELLASWHMDTEKFIYRVYKYDFQGFYFGK